VEVVRDLASASPTGPDRTEVERRELLPKTVRQWSGRTKAALAAMVVAFAIVDAART